jgi:hypothetical protein
MIPMKKTMTDFVHNTIENQKKRLRELTFYDVLRLIPDYGKVYVGWICLTYGVHMYDAGEYLPIVTQSPQVTSLFIMVLLGAVLAR